MERSAEHHRDYKTNKEVSQMVKHWVAAHPGHTKPLFHPYVIGQYKSALSRQVAEAVRIEKRGNVLNSVGAFNRCKLTRLVIDSEWEKKVWEESWQHRNTQDNLARALGDEGAELLENQVPERKKSKRERGPMKQRIAMIRGGNWRTGREWCGASRLSPGTGPKRSSSCPVGKQL